MVPSAVPKEIFKIAECCHRALEPGNKLPPPTQPDPEKRPHFPLCAFRTTVHPDRGYVRDPLFPKCRGYPGCVRTWVLGLTELSENPQPKRIRCLASSRRQQSRTITCVCRCQELGVLRGRCDWISLEKAPGELNVRVAKLLVEHLRGCQCNHRDGCSTRPPDVELVALVALR